MGNVIVNKTLSQTELALRGRKPMNPTQKAISEAKAKVCAEFEKICQTEKSLKRMVKEMHNIFDELEEDIAEITKA